jgi:hypothetical protein
MDQKVESVIGIYSTRAGVELAVEAFRDAGFRKADISLVLPPRMSPESSFAEGTPSTAKIGFPRDGEGDVRNGPIGWLEGASRATTPEGETCVFDGPIAETLAEVTAGRARMALAGVLMRIGIPQHEMAEYTDNFLQGRALLSISCDSEQKALAARGLHGDVGAIDVLTTCHMERSLGRFYQSMTHAVGR